MRTERGFDRLVAFTDAIVAIAMTLLVLPLADLPSEPHDSLWELLRENRGVLGAFALSFVVIARLWLAHHELTELIGGYDTAFLWLTMLWLFTIVVLPFPTELIGSEGSGRGVPAFYIGTLLVNSICLSGIGTLVRRRPALRREGVTDEDLRERGTPWLIPGLFLLALVLALLFPRVGLLSLFVLFAASVLHRRPSRRA